MVFAIVPTVSTRLSTIVCLYFAVHLLSPTPAPDTVAGEACQVSQGGGVYYLAIESPPTGDLSACDGNPLVPGGFDPVPEHFPKRSTPPTNT